MSEKYDVFRPNREVSDSFKLRPDGYADFVEYHFKHLSPDEPTVEVTRVHVPGIRRAEVDKAVAVYVDQMAKSSGEAFVKKGSNYLSETFDIIVDGTSIAVMVAPAVAQAAEIEALMKRKDYRMRIGAVTLGIDSKGDFFRTVPRDEYSGTGWKNSKPELVIEVVERLKNRIAVNASLGNHVNLKTRKTSLGRSNKARNLEKPLETGAFRLHQVGVYCIICTLTLEQNSWQPPRNTLLKSARFPSSTKRRE